ncbi:MAG: hypothetical protein DMG25_10170 [Acidobacteria bacterium]|nr:MAG: hypothetical protein DMG25_10170 [Acidobacteriota bacterium]
MKGASTLLVVVAAVAVIIDTANVCSETVAAQRSNVGGVNGRVGATKSGEVVPPESATIYVLYSNQMESARFSHGNDNDTASGQFHYYLNNLLEKNKELKSLQKRVHHNPQPGDANQMAAYYLQSVDEALTRVRSWLTKHPDRSWQLKTIAPDAQGFWSAEGLQPGGYSVVVRGRLPGYDADWEEEVDLAAGRTISLPLTRPRFFRHE